MNAPAEEAEAHAKVSKRENRLYVGNLPYDCNYKDLEKFMSGGGFGLDFLSGPLGCARPGCRGGVYRLAIPFGSQLQITLRSPC
jgi:hypothetical protein